MYDGSDGNAMTEVALALAMGFFSILVLALVSMGAAAVAQPERSVSTTLLQLAESESVEQPASALGAEDQIVIVHQGALLDSELAPLDPATLDPARRVVLAIDPAAPLDQALAAFRALARPDALVAPLDQRWRAALAGRGSTP